MIDAIELARWPRKQLPNGGVVLTEPRGAALTTLCIRPGIRPLRPLHEIVQDLAMHAGHLPRDVRRIGPILRLTTDEGEHGAMIELRVRIGSQTCHWVVAAVIDNDEMVVVEGTGRDARVAAAVVGLVQSLALGTDPHRIRMYAYRPPPGWFGVRRQLATCWLAPGFPRDPARIVVCDALSLQASSTAALMWPSPVSEPATSVEYGLLQGRRAVVRDSGRVFAAIELDDSVFRYGVSLHDGCDDHLAVVDQVVATIEPCPKRRLRAVGGGAVEAFEWMT